MRTDSVADQTVPADAAPDAPPRPHLLVALMADEHARALVAHAHALHQVLGGSWSAVSIDTAQSPRQPHALRSALIAALDHAERLGARVSRLSTGAHAMSSVITALVHRVRSEGATVLLIGRPRLDDALWSPQDRRLNHFADVLAELLPGVTIHVVAPAQAGPAAAPAMHAPRPQARVSARRRAREWAAGAAVLAGCTAACLLIEPFFAPANLVMVYLGGVVWVASRHTREVTLASVFGSVLLYDLLFVPPRWSLKPAEPQYGVAFLVMLTVGLLITHLSACSREQAFTAEARAQRTQAVNQLAMRLAQARSEAAVLEELHTALQSALGVRALALPGRDAEGMGAEPAARAFGVDVQALRAVLDDGHEAGASTARMATAPLRYLPLLTDAAPLGVVAMQPLPPERDTLEDQQLARALCNQAAVALERAQIERLGTEMAIEAERSRLRNTLLAGISHDFRTPLTTIIGNAGTLLDQGSALDGARREALLRDLLAQARRLHALSSNLLELTRLQEGAVQPALEWCPADELLDEAVAALQTRLAAHRVTRELAPDALVWCDPQLIGQVLANLLDNAARHAPAGGTITLAVRLLPGQWQLVVHDQGPGIPADQAEEVFRRFHRGRAGRDMDTDIDTDTDTNADGKGLGLAICAAVAELHGGRIRVVAGHGARFEMTLPQPAPPSLLQEPTP